LQNALPGIKGFSPTGMKNMRRFYEAYADFAIGQTVSDQLQAGILKDEAFFGISFSHHISLINKCKTTNESQRIRGTSRRLFVFGEEFFVGLLFFNRRLPEENASIGIVLCKEKNNTVVEFAVKTIDKAMGVATYRTTKEMPNEMRGILPDAAELAKLL
jgi:hypothetical protein